MSVCALSFRGLRAFHRVFCQDHGELAIGDVQKVWKFLGVSDGDLHDSGWARGDVQRGGRGSQDGVLCWDCS